MEQETIKSFIQQIELFNGLNDEELQVIASNIEERTYQKGELVFEENTPRARLFIIYQGRVELFKKSSYGDDKRITFFGKSDFLGEGALMDDYPHSTSAIAKEDSIILTIYRNSIEKLMQSHPQTVVKILSTVSRIISRRMRQTTNKVVDAAAQYVSGRTRKEHDLLGYRDVPYEFYYGIQTLRALENFNITDIPINHVPELIVALAQVKLACAKANYDLKILPEEIAFPMFQACEEIINGKNHIFFVVDMIQGGAGTSTNMNANEVIANRALEIMGYDKGDYDHCHPNNHVNLSQSTNDVYPTALNIALTYCNQKLVESLKELIASFHKKGIEFSDIIKMGRTQLQDAVPMTLGQEFESYAVTLSEEIERLNQNAKLFQEINLGGTAIGTGINTPVNYRELATSYLWEITGLPLRLATNLVEATQDTGAFVIYASALKRLAVKLSKICNDLRLLSSGPRAGLNEINLPKMQPGSSIMPGKVNPVIPEVVNQIAYKVIGNDITVTMAAEAGQLQLNVMEPIIAQSIFESIEILKNGITVLKHRCIDGITANRDRCRELVVNSIGIITALVPVLGYEICSVLAKDALENNVSVYDLVLERNYMTKEKLEELLLPENMIAPRNLE